MRRLGGVVIAIVVLALPACGSGDDADGRSGDDGPIATMLGAVPDTDTTSAFVIVDDITGAREAADLETLDGDADPDAVVDQLLALTVRNDGVVPYIGAFAGGQSPDVEAWADEFGFTFGQVDRDITAGAPPDQIQVVDGRFDLAAVDDAVQSDDIWSDVLDEEEIDGTTVYSWLDDGELDVGRVSPTRTLGESVRVAAVSDDRLAWARADDAIEAVVEADGRLSDREDLSEIADALDSAGTISAFLSAAADPGDEGPPGDLEPYPAFGVGGTVDEDGDPQLVIALWHPDEAAARANVDALEELAGSDEVLGPQEWREMETVSIEQEGRVVVGVFGVDDPRLWINLPLRGERLVRYVSESENESPG